MKVKPRILLLLPSNMFIGKIVDVCRLVSPYIHALDNSAERRHFFSAGFKSYSAAPFFIDGQINPKAVQEFEILCTRHAIDVVVPIDMDASAFLGAAKARVVGPRYIPFSSPEVLKRLGDKTSCAELAQRAGVEVPNGFVLTALAQLESAFFRAAVYPVIVKPPRLEGGRGVVHVETREELDRHLLSGSGYAALPLIIQEYVEGNDIDVDLIADHGKVVFQIAREQRAAGSAKFFHDRSLEIAAEAVVRASKYTGIANLDFRRDSKTGKYKFIEFNPRAWDNIWWTAFGGANFIALAVELALNGSVSTPPSPPEFRVFTTRRGVMAWLRGHAAEVTPANRRAIVRQLSHPVCSIVIRIEAALFNRRRNRSALLESNVFRMTCNETGAAPQPPGLPT
jgi:glutathione synthase/RimK-type ligase-like ATP-grasp enzyme